MRLRNLSLTIFLSLLFSFGVLALVQSPGIIQAAPRAPQELNPAYIDDAVAWIIDQQQPDGGFGSAGNTAKAIVALVSAGIDPTTIMTNSNSPLDSLALHVDSYTTTGWDPAHSTALVAQAVVAAGQNPHDFAGVNLVDRLNSHYDAATGTFGMGDEALAQYVLALAAVGETIPSAAVDTLKTNQAGDGGWEYLAGWGSAQDTTGRVMQALVVAGELPSSTELISATVYLSSTQENHGGWSTWYDGGAINVNLTANAIQGLIAVGLNPITDAISSTGNSPVDALLSIRNASTGAFQYGGLDNFVATIEVVPALQGQVFPYYGRRATNHRAIDHLVGAQQPDGGFMGLFGTDSGTTLDVVLGAVAADLDPRDWAQSGITTPLDYLADNAIAYTAHYTSEWSGVVYTTTAVAQTGKLIAGIVAAEAYTESIPGNMAYFAGIDLKAKLDDNLGWSPTDNTIADYAWAAIGYAALGEPVPAVVTQTLLALQEANGGWSYYGDYAYATTLAVQGLVGAGMSPASTELISATVFLNTLQDPASGGFGTDPSTPVANVAATANILQAIAALGLDVYDFAVSPDTVTMTVNLPDQWLMSNQAATGAFDGTPATTGQGLQGLSGSALPLTFRPVVVSTGLTRRTLVSQFGSFQAVFNTELTPGSVTTDTFTLTGPAGEVPCTVGYAGRTAALTPTRRLAGGAAYRLTVDGVAGARFGAASPPFHWDVVVGHQYFMPLTLKDY